MNKDEKTGMLEDDLEFIRILKAYFIKTCGGKYSEIVNSLKDGDIKNAHRIAHTIKGNAAQLGKTSLQKAAAEVENHLKTGENLLKDEHLKALETELNSALSELSGT
jgi:HPt (histidine-containing phosphotransfer) domain-containing protein